MQLQRRQGSAGAKQRTSSGKTVPEPTSSGKTVPEPTSSGKTVPEPTSSGKTVPEPTSSGKTVPEPTSSGKTVPEPTSRGKTVPEPTSSGKTVPEPTSSGKTVPEPTMSLSAFHLMQTLKNSPAAIRRRLRRDRTESLSHGDPLFKVYYLGTEKIFSLDLQQAQDAISRLLECAPGRPSKEHALVVRPRYVEVKEISTGRQLTKTFLQDIAYCAADSTHPNVFIYICKQRGQQLHCRVFWCSRAERARDLTACLAHSFQRAFSDWQDAVAVPAQVEALPVLEERPSTPSPPSRSLTLPASLGKVRWRKRSSLSTSPLRAILRRSSEGSDSRVWP